jgi:hypothetical protein
LSLQKLVGTDIVKVAGVLNGEDPGHAPETLQARSLHSSKRSNEGLDAIAAPVSPRSYKPLVNVSFSKANYLLTSSATDSETATFISTIWKTLAGTSDFYIPEHAPRKASSRQTLQRPSTSRAQNSPLEMTYSPFPRKSSHHAAAMTSPPLSPSSTAVPTMQPIPARSVPPPPPAKSVRPATATIQTSKTATGRKDRLRALRGGPKTDKTQPRSNTAETGSIYSYGAEEDYYDPEERRLMPMYVRRTAQKGNSRKALKWLGLA